MRTESGDYRRDYLRALAQRVEVDAQKRRVWKCPAFIEMAHPTRFERVASTFGG
jgi:hypothetical protein